MGATDWWFYPLMALAALGLIVTSLGASILERAATPQAAAREGSSFVFDQHKIAQGARLDDTHVMHVVRDFGVSAQSVRFAVRPNAPPPTAADTGVQLLLSPADAAALTGRTVDVELQLRRFTITAAGGIALSLQNGGPVTWVITPLPQTSGPMAVRLTAPAGAPPTALGLRLLTDQTDYNYGAEIRRITITPAP